MPDQTTTETYRALVDQATRAGHAAGRAYRETHSPAATTPPPDLVPVRLVPVEVFGTEDCCEHGDSAEHTDCPSIGFGLMDAVQAWSDCNRASGRIYRVEDTFSDHTDKTVQQFIDPDPADDHHREPGETLVVWVPREHLAWFLRRWNTSPDVTRDHEHVRGVTVPTGNPT